MLKNKKNLKNKTPVLLIPPLLPLLLLPLFFSCATAGKGYDEELDGLALFGALEDGGDLYLYVDAGKARPILDALTLPGMENMNEKQLAQILDKTDYAAAAYYPASSPRRFIASTHGSYPVFQANAAFTFNKAWKKERSAQGAQYWRSEKDGMSVSLNAKRAFVSDGDPFVDPPGKSPPEGFEAFQDGSALSGWVENAATPLNRWLADTLDIGVQIPAGRILFAVNPAGDAYEAKLRMATPSSTHAAGLTGVMRMAGVFAPVMPSSAALFKAFLANPPEQDGAYVNLRTGRLSEGELALLIASMSLYSK